ncbi:hypothetical protein GAGA_2892 [Paraglaciecola agarilytica NO2]|uniref:Uncharacterized protein n=1 Tax=Paraglaciecola agarilytica NO2 TaxID=1125747 RepID=A0ABQ0I8M0_9ALTE|nr:hypothetical protein GAGA_2892 [Paraglaciecola agarilytica NO2]
MGINQLLIVKQMSIANSIIKIVSAVGCMTALYLLESLGFN